MKFLSILFLFINLNVLAEELHCESSIKNALELIEANKLSKLADTLQVHYQSIEGTTIDLNTLDQLECYTELLISTRLFIKHSLTLLDANVINLAEYELASIRRVFQSNKKHVWVLANQYLNTLQNYIRLNSEICNIEKLNNGKRLLNLLINNFGDYFTTSQLERNVRFEQLNSSC